MTSRHALTAIAALALMPATASAHAILIASTPAVNGTVPAGSLAIKLHYNSRIDLGRSRVSLAGPDATTAAASHRLPITGTPAKDEFDASAAGLKPGTYAIRWQALALDGHITRGEVPFTVSPN